MGRWQFGQSIGLGASGIGVELREHDRIGVVIHLAGDFLGVRLARIDGRPSGELVIGADEASTHWDGAEASRRGVITVRD